MKILYWLVLVLLSSPAMAFQLNVDSSSANKRTPKTSVMVVGRVHTQGIFLYMGRVVNHNPAADIMVNVRTQNGWGFSVFKVWDLNDVHSGNNFMFGFLHKTFPIGKKVTIAPWIGTGLEQQHGFAGHGSDVMLQLVTNVKLKPHLTLEHIALFNNVMFETEFADWTNRFRLLESRGHWDVSAFYWHNNSLIDGRDYSSIGSSVYYTRIPVSKRVFIGAGITGLATIASSNTERVAKQSALQLNTIITFK